MYTILEVVYGIPLSDDEELMEEVNLFLLENKLKGEDFGFHILYNGVIDEIPAYIGIKIKEIEQLGTNLMKPYYDTKDFNISVKIKDKHKEKLKEILDKYPEDIKSKLPNNLGVYVMNSTS